MNKSKLKMARITQRGLPIHQKGCKDEIKINNED